jgi:hypothetical protein
MNIASMSDKVDDSVEIVIADKNGGFVDLSSECKNA